MAPSIYPAQLLGRPAVAHLLQAWAGRQAPPHVPTQTTYTSVPVTLATRERAYERLSRILLHLDGLNLNVVSIVRNGDNSVSITLNDEIPIAHLAHLAGQGF